MALLKKSMINGHTSTSSNWLMQFLKPFSFSENIILNTGIALFIFVALNGIFNAIAVSLGAKDSASTFLMPPHDLFGDYFKAIFSFIQNEKIDIRHGPQHLVQLLNTYKSQNPYRAIDLTFNIRSNLHGMPITTLFGLINLKVMAWLNPLYVFILVLIVVLSLTCTLLAGLKLKPREFLVLLLCIILCYPSLFIVVRGHIYSALTTLALLAFIILIYQKKPFKSLIFLAIAINFRPNSLIFILIFILCMPSVSVRQLVKYLLFFISLSCIIFLLSLELVHSIYNEYSWTNFVLAVEMYYKSYVVGNNGLAYGSSLLGALKMVTGTSNLLQPLVVFLMTALIGISIYLKITNKISSLIFIFLICVIYQLATSVFADYYLGIFFAPVVYQLLFVKGESISFFNSPGNVSFYWPYWSCILLLAPKNYIFIDNISLQVIINPLISLTIAFYVVGKSLFSSQFVYKNK
jgi:hypothetical protein